MGNIGKNVAHLLSGFDCDIRYYDEVRPSEELEKELEIAYMPLDRLLKTSDVITIHCPLLPTTFHLIGEKELRSMKPKAVLINTARGAIVDEMALVKVLSEGHLLGVGIDAWEKEPIDNTHPLCGFDNVLVSPHNGGGTVEAVAAVIRNSCINIRSMLISNSIAEEKYVVNLKALKEKGKYPNSSL